MCIHLRGALGSRVLFKGAQQRETGTKTARVILLQTDFIGSSPTYLKTPQGKRYLSEGFWIVWESQCSGVGLVGSWGLRVFGLLRAGIVDQQIWALQGMMWISAVQQITGKPSRSHVPRKLCLPVTKMVLNSSIDTGSSVGTHCIPNAGCPAPS